MNELDRLRANMAVNGSGFFSTNAVAENLREAQRWWNAEEVAEPVITSLLADAISEIERLEAECFRLAATQCSHPVAGEYGHMLCARPSDFLSGLDGSRGLTAEKDRQPTCQTCGNTGTVTEAEAQCCGRQRDQCCGMPIPVPVPAPCPTCHGGELLPSRLGDKKMDNEAFNKLSESYGRMFDIAVSLRDTLCRVLDTAERRTKAGLPLEQDEIDAMTARLVADTERLYGPGRPVRPHASGPAQFYPPHQSGTENGR